MYDAILNRMRLLFEETTETASVLIRTWYDGHKLVITTVGSCGKSLDSICIVSVTTCSDLTLVHLHNKVNVAVLPNEPVSVCYIEIPIS